MGVTPNSCSQSLSDGPGDQTAGLIWLNSVDNQHPFWGFTHVTNYPFGEQLSSPVHASGSALYILYWILARASGSVCGLNLLNAIGFFSGALVTFFFVKWLVNRPFVALLAGYAVSFTPYLQIKTGVHASYVFQGLFVGMIWIFLLLWRKPSLKLAAAFGGITAVSFYVDPYFVLLSGILAVGLFIGGGIYEVTLRTSAPSILRKFGYGLAALGIVVALIMPLVFIRVHYASQIDRFVNNSRNDIKFDAQIYGAHPIEYLKPNELQPVLKALIPNYAKYRDHHNSNPSEYTINLSLALIATVLLAAFVVVWRFWRKQAIWPNAKLAVKPGLIVIPIAVVGVLAFSFSLAPIIHGHRMPSWYLTNYITMWRVFARLYIIVNISLVILASVALAFLLPMLKWRVWQRVCIILLLLVVMFEYQTFAFARTTWSYVSEVPSIYYQLHDRADVKVVAEYSLDEQPQTIMPTYYMTYQRIHGKELINSDLPDSPQAPIRQSIRNLADPQTLPTLRALGVDAVIVHDVPGDLAIPGLTRILYEQSRPPSSNPVFGDMDIVYPIAVYHIGAGPVAPYVLAIESGYVFPQKLSPISYNYVGGNGSTLELVNLPGSEKIQTGQFCFSIRSESGKLLAISFVQGGNLLWSGTIDAQWQPVSFSGATSKLVTIKDSSLNKTSFMINNLGCAP